MNFVLARKIDFYSYRIPFGVVDFRLKFGELSSIVDDSEQFPDEQQGQAETQYAQDDAENHDPCADRFGTDWKQKLMLLIHERSVNNK